ncbi:MAG: hypothetical protein HGA45_25195, partial [Chloroflexales bacterium]|nr:hypothetical protein [Chloroflexales bacterium]
ARAALADPAAQAELEGLIAAHRAHLCFFNGDYAQTIRAAQTARRQLPGAQTVLRARTAVLLGNGLRYAGQLQAATTIHAQAAAEIEPTGNVYVASLNFCSLGELHRELGQLPRALEAYEQALAFARRHLGRPESPFTGLAYTGIGLLRREWNDLEAAGAALHQGVALSRAWQQAEALTIGLMELAFFYQDTGAYDLARQALAEARQIVAAASSPWGVATVDAFLARLALAQGDVPSAERWAQASGLASHDAPEFVRGEEYQALAETLLAAGRAGEALRVWHGLEQQYRAAGRLGRLLRVRVWQARALDAAGERSAALSVLGEALALGRPAAYTRTFVAPGAPIAELLRLLPANAYRDQVLGAFVGAGGTAAAPQGLETAVALTTLPEPLGDRERTILRLLAAGLTNREIGAELYLSINTVRWYLSQIYAKLEVAGRREAVARARELRVI